MSNLIERIESLLGEDVYDSEDPKINRINKLVKKIVQSLKSDYKIKVIKSEPADYESDASIELPNNFILQIELDGLIHLIKKEGTSSVRYLVAGRSLDKIMDVYQRKVNNENI
jgi:hypothetical protein